MTHRTVPVQGEHRFRALPQGTPGEVPGRRRGCWVRALSFLVSLLGVASGTGSLGGTVTGTIAAGASSTTINGARYSIAQGGVSLTATQTSGTVYVATCSQQWQTMAAPQNTPLDATEFGGFFLGVLISTLTFYFAGVLPIGMFLRFIRQSIRNLL